MKKVFLIGTLMCIICFISACSKERHLIGKWEYTTATVHHINEYYGVDTTFTASPVNSQTPILDEITFNADGTANMYNETWSWTLKDDTIHLAYQYNSDGSEYHQVDMLWKIESLSSKEFVAAWRRETNGVAGPDIWITTTTFHR